MHDVQNKTNLFHDIDRGLNLERRDSECIDKFLQKAPNTKKERLPYHT